MLQTNTSFDPQAHHIYTQLVVTHPQTGTHHNFLAIIDTGAPTTEFVDSVLIQAGFIDRLQQHVEIKESLQSQKYGKITFPTIEICGHVIHNFTAHVSKLDASWGIDALIGLDFFRRFEVKINYKQAQITVGPL